MSVGSIISLGIIQNILKESDHITKPKNPVLQLVRVNPGNSGEQGGSRYK
jgi:hypothetical protein